MKRIFFACLFSLAGITLSAAPVNYHLTGHFPDSLNGLRVYLYVLSTGKSMIDSSTIKNGTFTMSGSYAAPRLARLRIEKNRKLWGSVEFGLEETPTTFTYDGKNILVKGGPRTEAVQDFAQVHAERSKKLKDHNISIKTLLSQNTSKEELLKRNRILKEADSVFHEKMVALVKKHADNAIGAYYFESISERLSIEEQDQILAIANKEFLESPNTQRNIASRKQGVGQMYSDFTLPDKDGKMHKLSEYVGKGSYILVDFWASWCVGCRLKTPHIINAYEKHKGKGFNVVSVSIDANRGAWLKAMEKDKMPDSWHNLLDTKSSVRKIYGIQTIPITLLIDPNGKIVANDMSLTNLENVIDQFVK